MPSLPANIAQMINRNQIHSLLDKTLLLCGPTTRHLGKRPSRATPGKSTVPHRSRILVHRRLRSPRSSPMAMGQIYHAGQQGRRNHLGWPRKPPCPRLLYLLRNLSQARSLHPTGLRLPTPVQTHLVRHQDRHRPRESPHPLLVPPPTLHDLLPRLSCKSLLSHETRRQVPTRRHHLRRHRRLAGRTSLTQSRPPLHLLHNLVPQYLVHSLAFHFTLSHHSVRLAILDHRHRGRRRHRSVSQKLPHQFGLYRLRVSTLSSRLESARGTYLMPRWRCSWHKKSTRNSWFARRS